MIEKQFGYNLKSESILDDMNRIIYKFRFDMVIQGILIGFILVLVILLLSDKLKTNLPLWYIILNFGVLSLKDLSTWRSENPIAYEISLIVSRIVGYTIGFIVLL